MRGSITDEDREFVETWENVSLQANAIIRLNVRGEEKHEVIQGQRTFMVTTEERIIFQDRVLDPANDPFLNGCFRPVTVPASVTPTTNPNSVNDQEIRSILKSSDIAWDEWMNVLTSPQTIQRMLGLADDMGDISLKRYRELQDKLAKLKPKTRITQKDADKFEEIRTGGRSSDYR